MIKDKNDYVKILSNFTINGGSKQIYLPEIRKTSTQKTKINELINKCNEKKSFNIKAITTDDILDYCKLCINKKQCGQPIYIDLIQCNNYEKK